MSFKNWPVLDAGTNTIIDHRDFNHKGDIQSSAKYSWSKQFQKFPNSLQHFINNFKSLKH
jgi:hypothetical protein